MKIKKEKIDFISFSIEEKQETKYEKKHIELKVRISYDENFIKYFSKYGHSFQLNLYKEIPETIKEYMEINEVNEKELIDILNNKTINHE